MDFETFSDTLQVIMAEREREVTPPFTADGLRDEYEKAAEELSAVEEQMAPFAQQAVDLRRRCRTLHRTLILMDENPFHPIQGE